MLYVETYKFSCVGACVQIVEKEYKQQVAEGRVSDEVKFSYAWHLIKSGYKNDIRKGIRLMEGEQNGVNRVQG